MLGQFTWHVSGKSPSASRLLSKSRAKHLLVTMAKSLSTLPNMAALLVWRSHFFCNQSLGCFQATTRVLPSGPRLFSSGKGSIPPGLGRVSLVYRRNFCLRAANEVGGSGSVDSTLIQSMEKKIKEQLDAELVTVKDAYGDGRHVSIEVISSAFEGQSALNRQRMVYKAIWEELQDTVHAVDQMSTRTPVEAASSK